MATVGRHFFPNPSHPRIFALCPCLFFSDVIKQFLILKSSVSSSIPRTKPQASDKKRYFFLRSTFFKPKASMRGRCFRCFRAGYLARDYRGLVLCHKYGRPGHLKVACKWIPNSSQVSVDSSVARSLLGFRDKLVDFCKEVGQSHRMEGRSRMDCLNGLISSFDHSLAPLLDPKKTSTLEIFLTSPDEGEFFDDLFFISSHMPSAPVVVDAILLDPAVECLKIQNRGGDCSCEVMDGSVMEIEVVKIARIPINSSLDSLCMTPRSPIVVVYDLSSSCRNSTFTSLGRPAHLNLHPVSFMDISKIEIIGDFEDY